jgi:uncharacterized membrane protein YeaQ/YmgE (transglycosylase-associated protein family)
VVPFLRSRRIQGSDARGRRIGLALRQVLVQTLYVKSSWERAMGIIWTIIIGFLAGLVAKWIMPGKNEPSGFILTTILGIIGAFVASYLGQAVGWYRAGEGAGFIGAVVGAIIVLAIYGMIAGRRSRV